jgi:hypothetical protein
MRMLDENPSEDDREAAIRIIGYVAKYCPALIRPLESEFETALRRVVKGKNTDMKGLREVCLAALAGMAKEHKGGDGMGIVKLAKDVLLSETVSGKEAKFAARIIGAYAKEGKAEGKVCDDVLSVSRLSLFSYHVLDSLIEIRN